MVLDVDTHLETHPVDTPRAPGRPPDPAVAPAVLDAVIELVAERGYERTTLDAVAARAGVGKPAIYRRWPGGKQEVVAAAVSALRRSMTPALDTGSLRGDLLMLAESAIAGVARCAQLAAGLTQRLRESPELASLFRETVVAEDRTRFMEILQRAAGRGELARLPEAATLVADLVPAVVLFRALVATEEPGAALARQIVDGLVLPALGAATGTRGVSAATEARR